MIEKFSFGLFLVAAFAWPTFVQAKTPASLIDSVAKVEVYRGDQTRDRFGSGFFVDFTGCLLTNAHVSIDLEKNSPAEKIEISVSKNLRRKPEIIGPAKVVYFDPEVDISVVCLDSPDFFPELELANGAQVDAVTFGDNVKIIGFPLSGSETVTYAQGQVLGFWEQPDIAQISGAEKVKSERVTLIKLDAVSGSGGSGSPVIDKDDRVVAIMFAGQSFSALPGLAIWTKSFANWEEKVNASQPLAEGCVFDPLFSSYVKGGKQYYDSSCQIDRDKNLESLVAVNFQARCPGKLEDKKVMKAAAHIKKKSSIDKWFQYLVKICPTPATPPAPVPAAVPPPGPALTAPAKVLTKGVKVWYFK